MPETLRLEIADHIATLTIESLTMTPQFFDELGEAFAALERDETVRVVLVCGTGKAFSYGLDLPRVMQAHGQLFAGGGLAAQRTELLGLIHGWQDVFTRIAECRVPVIAAIHGWCIGGGLDLATACDIRLATADARISLRETRIAIVADLGSLQRLPAIIGEGHARQMAFTGEDISADKALRMGLVNDVYATREQLLEEARTLAARIAANPPLVVRGVKEVMAQRERSTVREGLRYVAAWNAAFLASEDLSEALAAFMEKREPTYRGR